MKRNTFLALAVTVLITGCVTRRSVEDGVVLRPGQGVLAFKIDSNIAANLAYVQYERESTFASRFSEHMIGPKGSFAINGGELYFVTAVDAGQYMWSRFTVYQKMARLHSSNRFVVKANSITYIGHVRVFSTSDRVRITALDREDDMKAHLREHFPKFLQSMPFTKEIAEFSL